jgi:hypothetical protein
MLVIIVTPIVTAMLYMFDTIFLGVPLTAWTDTMLSVLYLRSIALSWWWLMGASAGIVIGLYFYLDWKKEDIAKKWEAPMPTR